MAKYVNSFTRYLSNCPLILPFSFFCGEIRAKNPLKALQTSRQHSGFVDGKRGRRTSGATATFTVQTEESDFSTMFFTGSFIPFRLDKFHF